MCPLYLLYFLLCGLHFNHLFIWLDPEVVAHDAYCDEGGLFKFPFGLLEQYSFGGWNLYRYYSQNCRAQDEANDDSFKKKL
jgi:hypothetical protein